MQFLSFQIDPPFIRIAHIDKKNSSFTIKSLKTHPFPAVNNVKPLYKKRFRGKKISGLSGTDLFIKEIELKVGKGPHIEQALIFQAETSLFFSSEEVLEVPYLLKKGKEGTKALLFTVSCERLESHLNEMSQLQIDPDRVGAWPLALTRYILWKYPSLKEGYLIDLSSSSWTVLWIEAGELKRSFSVLGGTEALLKAYWEDKKTTLLFEELESLAKEVNVKKLYVEDHPTFYAELSKMRLELAKAIFAFYQQGGVKPVFFTGRVDAFRNLTEFLKDGFEDAVTSPQQAQIATEELKYAVAIGLALEPSLQLRQGKFFPKRVLQKMGKVAFSLALFSLICSGGLYFLGKEVIDKKKENLSYALTTAIQKFDPGFHAKTEHLESLFYDWLEKLQQNASEYPFIAKNRTSSEVLSWLYNHPLVKSFRKEGDPIEIVDFRYELLEFPSIKHKRNPYLVKVELAFHIKDPIYARKFHEMLLKEKKWIDPDQEISWDLQNGLYHTSFCLKNRDNDDF